MITRFTGTPMRESGHATRLRTSEAIATPIAVGTHHERPIRAPAAAVQKATASSSQGEPSGRRRSSCLQASLNTRALDWPLANGAGPAGSLQSLVQRQFSISGRSSRCSRM